MSSIIGAWQGMIDASAVVSVHHVAPHPPTNPDSIEIAAFMIVVQHPIDAMQPVLVTKHEENHFLHGAHFVPAALTRKPLLRTTGLQERCLSRRATLWCIRQYSTLAIPTRLDMVMGRQRI